jgi:hypothetical protein
MSHPYDALVIRTGVVSAKALRPGEVLRALAVLSRSDAEDVGLMEPLSSGAVKCEVIRERARRLSTPCTFPVITNAGICLYELTRHTDPPEAGTASAVLEWQEEPPPSPGAIARALSGTSQILLGGEELQIGWVQPRACRLTLSGAAALRAGTTRTIEDGDRSFTLTGETIHA